MCRWLCRAARADDRDLVRIVPSADESLELTATLARGRGGTRPGEGRVLPQEGA